MASRSQSTTFWIIADREDIRIGLLTIDLDGDGARETLPVFSFEEEARLFLGFGASESSNWRVRESTAGELTSILFGPYANVRRVALDPLPVEVGGEAMMDLLSLERERFLRSLVEELSAPSRVGSFATRDSPEG